MSRQSKQDRYDAMTRWQRWKWHADRGDYNLHALLLFFSLPGLLWLIAEWIG